jgi:hypothetical protein
MPPRFNNALTANVPDVRTTPGVIPVGLILHPETGPRNVIVCACFRHGAAADAGVLTLGVWGKEEKRFSRQDR